MEKVQNVFVGLQHTGLAISDSMLLTEGLDKRPRLPQSVPGYSWEKMMLDLIVQSPIPKVDQRRTLDVTRCKYLLTQEVRWAVLIHDEHPFMIGGTDRTEVQSKKRVMNDNKYKNLPETQPPEQQTNVKPIVERQQ